MGTFVHGVAARPLTCGAFRLCALVVHSALILVRQPAGAGNVSVSVVCVPGRMGGSAGLIMSQVTV